MSEEEKEAIKYLEFLSNEKCECEACQHAKKEYKTILNVIDKQQKEIEELNTELEIRIKWQQYFEKEYVSKDKIREKIQEIDGKGTFDAKIVLEHLLEENNEKSDTL